LIIHIYSGFKHRLQKSCHESCQKVVQKANFSWGGNFSCGRNLFGKGDFPWEGTFYPLSSSVLLISFIGGTPLPPLGQGAAKWEKALIQPELSQYNKTVWCRIINVEKEEY